MKKPHLGPPSEVRLAGYLIFIASVQGICVTAGQWSAFWLAFSFALALVLAVSAARPLWSCAALVLLAAVYVSAVRIHEPEEGTRRALREAASGEEKVFFKFSGTVVETPRRPRYGELRLSVSAILSIDCSPEECDKNVAPTKEGDPLIKEGDTPTEEGDPLIKERDTPTEERDLSVGATFLSHSSGDRTIAAKILLSAPDLPWTDQSRIQPGDTVEGLALFPPGALFAAPPPAMSWQGTLFRRGYAGAGIAKEIRRIGSDTKRASYREWTTSVVERFPENGAVPVLFAAVLGAGDMLSPQDVDLLRETGTTHLIVVSGFQVGVLFSLFCAAARFLLSHWLWLIRRAPVQPLAACAGAAGAIAYASLVGESIPTERALIIVLLMSGASAFGRKQQCERGLILSASILLFIFPGAFLEPGFQLTFAALAGLRVGSALAGDEESELVTLLPQLRKLRTLAAECAGAFLFTAPICLLWFENLCLAAPLINIAVIPPFTYCTVIFGGISLLLDYAAFPGSHTLLALALWSTSQVLALIRTLGALAAAAGLDALLLEQGTARVMAVAVITIDVIFVHIVWKRRNSETVLR